MLPLLIFDIACHRVSLTIRVGDGSFNAWG
jgi:hypothetical protein